MDVSFIIRLIDQFTEPAKKVRSGMGVLKAGATGLRDGLADGIKEGFSVANIEEASRNAEQALSKAKGRLVGALAMGAAIFAPVKVAADFETAMNQVAAVSNATGDQLDAMKQQALDLGRTTQYTASQVADAMGFLAMAGLKVDDILGATPATLQLAAAAQMDLAQAADIVTNILAGYNKEIEELGHVNDVLVKTFTSSNTDLVQLGDAMKYAGPVAASAGVQFEETAAALGMMGNAGFQGTLGGTALRGAIVRMLAPTKQASELMESMGLTAEDMTDDVAGLDAELDASRAAMEAMGLQVTDAQGRMLPLADIIRQLEPHAENTGLMMQLFGQRAGPAMVALLSQGSEAFEQLVYDLENSAGTAEHVANVQLQGFNGMWLQIKSALEGTTIALGSLLIPALVELGAQLVPIINAVTDWVYANPELSTTLVQVVAGVMALSIASRLLTFALAATRLPLLGLLTTFLKFDEAGKNIATGWRVLAGAGQVIGWMFGILKAGATGVLTVLAGVTAPVWAIVAALAAAGFAVWKYWDRISAFVSGFFAPFGELAAGAMEAIGNAVDWMLAKLAELTGWNPEAIKEALASAFNLTWLVDGAREQLERFWNWLGEFFSQEKLSEDQKAELAGAGRAIGQALIDGVKAAAVALWDWFAQWPAMIRGAIGQINLSDLFQLPEIGGPFGDFLNGAGSAAGSLLDGIGGFLGGGQGLEVENADAAGRALGENALAALGAETAGALFGRAAAAQIKAAASAIRVEGNSSLANALASARTGALHGGDD